MVAIVVSVIDVVAVLLPVVAEAAYADAVVHY
jgi:hypothetical protein